MDLEIENDFNAVIESEVKGSTTEFPIPVTIIFSQPVQSITQSNVIVVTINLIYCRWKTDKFRPFPSPPRPRLSCL